MDPLGQAGGFPSQQGETRKRMTTGRTNAVMTEKGGTRKWGGRLALFLILAAVGFTADLGTKRIVFDRLGFPDGRIHWLIPDVFGFQTSLNEGALFGMGAGQIPFFVIASVIALIGVVFWFHFDGYKSRTATTALGLIAAGILGNLWDRLAFHGMIWPDGLVPEMTGEPIHAVRDWILVMIGSYHWPNFNLADSGLVVGTGLMMIYLLFLQPKAETAGTGTNKESAGETETK